MKCPKCKSFNQHIVDSRTESSCVKRRRECKDCGYRFSTTEIQNDKLNQYEKDRDLLHEIMIRARKVAEQGGRT